MKVIGMHRGRNNSTVYGLLVLHTTIKLLLTSAAEVDFWEGQSSTKLLSEENVMRELYPI